MSECTLPLTSNLAPLSCQWATTIHSANVVNSVACGPGAGIWGENVEPWNKKGGASGDNSLAHSIISVVSRHLASRCSFQ